MWLSLIHIWIEKSLKEQSFSVKRADKEDIKRILAVYYEQNVTTEKFEDFDGEQMCIRDSYWDSVFWLLLRRLFLYPLAL